MNFARIATTVMMGAWTIVASGLAMADPAAPEDVAAGWRIWRQKGNCQTCHGWAADGRKMDSQMPDGANLRETSLERDDLHMTIKCGRPGAGMPAFDRLAYSDGRCHGIKKADLDKAGLELTDPPAPLAQREMELVVDFLFAKVIHKGPMNHETCIEFWGSEVEVCSEFPR